MSNQMPSSAYPVNLEVDYPDRALNRLTTAFRIILILPILAVLALVSGPAWTPRGHSFAIVIATGGLLFVPTLLMLLFRQKYPRWWFDWNVALTRFSLRVGSYFALLTDSYPSTEDEQAVHAEIPYPDVQKELLTGLPLVKWFLAIPHYVVLFFLAIAAVIVILIAWFAILFTGRYPRSLFDFVVGVLRWGLRVNGYAFLLVTDHYPPFSLK